MATAAIEPNPPDPAPYGEACPSKTASSKQGEGLRQYYLQHLHDLQLQVRQKTHNLTRLEAQSYDLNSKVRVLKDLQLLQEPGSYVGEVVKVMGKSKVLVKMPRGRVKRGDRTWQIAFGSGFKCNSAVWKALRAIDPAKEKNPWMDEIHQFPVDVPKVAAI